MSVAKDIIIPNQEGTFRVVFLYVGQGEATLLVVPNGQNFKYVLIDTNINIENEGIDLISLLKDLLGNNKLDIFINTHPHNDHLSGIKRIYSEIGITEIWHSGHNPGKEHEDAYKELEEVIESVGKDKVFQLKGTEEENKLDGKVHPIGDIIYKVLAPADYVCKDIEGEKPEERYLRIHEQCAVIKFCYGEKKACILITGDSDLKAWKEHITEFHKIDLPSDVLSASHHGSRTFFMNNEKDVPYRNHIDIIKPTYIIISAPKQSESKHDHPHDDAIKIYKEYADEENIFHLGCYNKKRVCIIVDITKKGDLNVDVDGKLCETYKTKNENDKNENKSNRAITITKIDNKPMGN